MTIPDDLSLRIDEERVRDTGDAEAPPQLARLVVGVCVLDLLGLDPSLGVFLALLGDPEDREALLGVFVLELVEVRNCTSAGPSPVREEFDQDRSAGEVIQRLCLGLAEVGELDLRELTSRAGAGDEECERRKRYRREQQGTSVHEGMPSRVEEPTGVQA
jgi:hypothetical protein